MGQNLSRWRFLDPAAKHVYPEWDEATALAVGGLRELSADDPDDPRLLALIDELSSRSHAPPNSPSMHALDQFRESLRRNPVSGR